MSMRVLCIWLPNWPSQRANAAKLRADSNGSTPTVGPIVLHARDARRGRVVAAANATARTMGVLPQMPLSQASTLCPDAHLVEYDPHSDIEALCSMAEAAQCFSPIVGIEQIDPQPWAGRSIHQPQAILLNVTGIGPLFGGEESLAQIVHNWIADQGYLASIAIANRVGTAWAMANFAHRQNLATALMSIESQSSTDAIPSFLSILPHHDANETENEIEARIAMFPLAIESLRLDLATVTKLHRLGIKTIGQLMELPRNGLASRFTDQLLTRIDQALGDREEPIVSLHAAPELAIEEVLEHPTPVRETIDAIISIQMRQLTKSLESIGHGALRLVCRIELERNAIPIESDIVHQSTDPNRVARVFQIGLYQPSHDADHLLWLLRGQLDAHYSKGPSHFWARSIALQTTLTSPVTWQQNDLFDRHSVVHRDAIAKLVDVLSSRMGRTAVVAPTVHRDPQPELAYSWRPLTGWRSDGIQQDTKRKLARAPKRDFATTQGIEASPADFWRRPMRMLQPPKGITIEHANDDGAPLQIEYQNAKQKVQSAIGPERIDTGWWQGVTQQRDYYRIELSNGVWLWIYRDRRNHQWFLHGEFD